MSVVSSEDDEEHEPVNGLELPNDPDDEPLVSEDNEEDDQETEDEGDES